MEIDNLILKKHETVHTYGWYLRKYVAGYEGQRRDADHLLADTAQDVEATARSARNGKDYAGWAQQVAESGACRALSI